MFLYMFLKSIAPTKFKMLAIYQVSLASCTLYMLYLFYWQLTVGLYRRRLIKKHRCGTIKTLPEWDLLLGLQNVFNITKWLRQHTYLHNAQKRFASLGTDTFFQRRLGLSIISTIEPENLKTIQSLDFNKWGLGKGRIQGFIPFIGSGIFTTDGMSWMRSREMLRPNFVRSQVRDLATFEMHVGRLIDAVPKDESMVNLKDLFFRLTMDSMAELLFGESTNCLTSGTGSVHSARFAEAWQSCHAAMRIMLLAGKLGRLLFPGKIAHDRRYVHGTIRFLCLKNLSGKNSFPLRLSFILFQSLNPFSFLGFISMLHSTLLY